MNSQFHRVIFNAARSYRMAVADTARGCGKGGATGATRTGQRRHVSASRFEQNWPLALAEYALAAIDCVAHANAAGGIDNSGGRLSAGEWVQLDSQGVGLINTGGVIQGGKLYADITGNVTGQSAQLSGHKVALSTGTLDKDGKRHGGGSIDLQSLQMQGSAASADHSQLTQDKTTVQGTITAQNGITIQAGQDIIQGAQAVDAGSLEHNFRTTSSRACMCENERAFAKRFICG